MYSDRADVWGCKKPEPDADVYPASVSNDLLSVPIRTEKLDPDSYRLAMKVSGEFVLQGAFFWQEGNDYGHEWRDLPTIHLDR